MLSHGQYCVERGFSDNKDVLKNNIDDESLVSHRMAYDGIKNQGDPIEDSITKEQRNFLCLTGIMLIQDTRLQLK